MQRHHRVRSSMRARTAPANSTTLRDWTDRLPKHRGDFLRLRLTTHVVSLSDDDDWIKWRRQWQQELQQKTLINSLEVLVKDCDNEDDEANADGTVARLYQVLTDFGNLPNLKALKVRGYCNVMPVSVLTELLQGACQLMSFHLAYVEMNGNQSDLDCLTVAISNHAFLKEWKLHSCEFIANEDDDDDSEDDNTTNSISFLDSVLAGVSSSPSLESLFVSPTSPTAMGGLSVSSIQGLCIATKLKSLCFYDEIDNFFIKDQQYDDQSPLDALMNLLASNQIQSLQHLHIPFFPTKYNCQQLYRVLKTNHTLQGLAIETFEQQQQSNESGQQQQQQHLTLLAQGLKENCHLKHFSLLGPASRIRYYPQVVQAFANVLEVNYTLHELDIVDLMMSHDHRERVDFLSQLNVKGRKQWLRDIYENDDRDEDKEEQKHQQQQLEEDQFVVLQQLAKRTDDLYYYLSVMNPSLVGNL